jgi:hypothetical protein
LGYERKTYQKGVYFDGHEREDLVAYCQEFLAEIEKYELLVTNCYQKTPVSSASVLLSNTVTMMNHCHYCFLQVNSITSLLTIMSLVFTPMTNHPHVGLPMVSSHYTRRAVDG